MNLRKLGGLALVAFALFYAITNPSDAASFVHSVTGGVTAFATELAEGDAR
jgi:hypothetical protein